ncbi:hypothetical protein GCM10022420_027720 [Streptomyces iranensis]
MSVAAPYKHFADRETLLAELATKGYREQRDRFAVAVGGGEDPVERLASFASAYVRFAAEESALFDITFNAGLDKSRFAEIALAGDEVTGLLLPVARQLAPDPGHASDPARTGRYAYRTTGPVPSAVPTYLWVLGTGARPGESGGGRSEGRRIG